MTFVHTQSHCDVHKLRNNHDVRDEGAVSGGGVIPDSNPTGIRTTDGTTVNDGSGNAQHGDDGNFQPGNGGNAQPDCSNVQHGNGGNTQPGDASTSAQPGNGGTAQPGVPVLVRNLEMVVMPSLGMPVLVRNVEMVVMPNLEMPVLMRNLEMEVMLNPVVVLRHLVTTIKMNQAAQRVVVHNLVALPVMVVLFPKVVSVNMEALVDKSAASNLITGATLMNQRALPQRWQLLCRRCQTHMTNGKKRDQSRVQGIIMSTVKAFLVNLVTVVSKLDLNRTVKCI